MAKVVAPLMSQEVRGKLGGTIFNTYRGIATCKSFKSPTQPNSAAQINARARLADASRAWGSLTAVQRAAWEVYSEAHLEPDWTGKPKRLTGENCFVRCYTRANLVGGSVIADAPSVSAPATPVITSIAHNAGSGGKIEVNYPSPPASGIVWVFYAAGPLSMGRVPKFEMAKIKHLELQTDTSPSDIITAPTSGRYGIWYQAISKTTGLASALAFAGVDSW